MRNATNSRPRWRARVAAALSAAAALVFIQAAPAMADYYDGGMPGKTFSVRYVGVNTTYTTHFNTARSNWNGAGIGVSITTSSSASATMTAGSYTTQSWYGIYTPSCIRACRSFSIQLNAHTITRDSPNVSAWIRSTATHELGHALSLADNPNTTAISLMKHSRDRTAVQTPQAYDRNEVVRIYG